VSLVPRPILLNSYQFQSGNLNSISMETNMATIDWGYHRPG
jgi:hypothetical protein